MHALDIIIALITLFFVFTGLRRGLIGEVIRLSAMVAGFVVAFLYYNELGSRFPFNQIPVQSPIRSALAFLFIYLMCAIVILAAGWLVRKIVHLTPLAWIDRSAGALIGVLKAMLIAWVVCLSISSLPIRRIRSDFSGSIVYRAFTALPEGLTLKSLLKNRDRIRAALGDKRFKGLKSPKKRLDFVKEAFQTQEGDSISEIER